MTGITLESALLILALTSARIAPAVVFLPILNSATLQFGALRATVLLVIGVGLLPVIAPNVPLGWDTPGLIPLILKEALLGFALGLIFCAPFYAVHAMGEFIDNQRGATLSNTIDPSVGVEASPLSSFLMFFWTTVFVGSDGLKKFFTMMADSYRLVPLERPFTFTLASVLHITHALSSALFAGIVAAMPAIAAMLFIEIILGIMSRFASQLNPFSTALIVKSGAACLILLFYLRPWLFEQIGQLHRLSGAAQLIQQ
jgi:type III secretion protein SpaR/YscT/HrcT